MTMTPEPKIMHSPLSGCWYLVTKYKARKDGGFEALKKIDISDEIEKVIAPLTAEIATLKAEVERLQTIALCGDKSHLLVIRERDTLRAQRDALVKAGEKGIEAYCALCDVLSDLPTCIEDIVEDYQMHSDAIDALSAAVREAKGEE